QNIVSQTAKKIMDAIKTQMQVRSLGYPEVAIQLFRPPDQTKVFSYNSTQSLNQRIAQIYGPSVACDLDFISFEYEGFQLSGSMSRSPVLGRIQHIFANECLWDPPELLTVVESVLAASDYYSKANTANAVGSPSRARARHPIFVFSIASPTSLTGTGEAELEYKTRSTGLKVSTELRQLVVFACVKFLRKLEMISDQQIRMVLDHGLSRKRSFESAIDNACHKASGCGKPVPVPAPVPAPVQHKPWPSATRTDTVNRRFPIRSSIQRPIPAPMPIRCSDEESAESQKALPRSSYQNHLEIPKVGIDRYWNFGLGNSDSVSANEIKQPIDIASLRVIGQADKKFIMCREARGPWLVVVDQHAADERIRLEQNYTTLSSTLAALACLCPSRPITMAEGVCVLFPPVSIALSSHNAAALLDLQDRLRLLGLRISAQGSSGCGAAVADSETVDMRLLCVPSVIAPRLKGSGQAAGRFAKELLLSIAGWCADHPGTHYAQTNGAEEDAFPRLIDVPPIVLETLKSISCRGAVKFNEQLSHEQCRDMVARLAKCTFPAFCAHGR
ncbi:DNA mismatch repair protein, partial [Coemansia sp. RSA 486]